MNQHFIFLNTNLQENLADTESKIFKHYQTFSEKFNRDNIYLYLDHYSDLKKTFSDLKVKNLISRKAIAINIYDFFLKDCEHIRRTTLELESNKNDIALQKFHQDRCSITYHKETKLVDFIEFYDDKKNRYRKDKYDEQGFLAISTIFNSHSLKPQYVNYYRQDGTLAISLYYVEKHGEHKLSHIVVFDKTGAACESFISEDELRFYLICYYLNHFSHRDQITLAMESTQYLKEIQNYDFASRMQYLYFENDELI